MTWDSEAEMYDTQTGAHQDPCEENPCDACRAHLARLTPRDRVLSDISVERDRQIAKWGPQSHPDGTGGYPLERTTVNLDFRTARELANIFRRKCDMESKSPETDSWLNILLEEVFEGSAETEWPSLRKELVQSAAVIVAWIEDGDKRSA